MLRPNAIVSAVTMAAISITDNYTSDQVNLLASVLCQLADTLTTILTVQQINQDDIGADSSGNSDSTDSTGSSDSADNSNNSDNSNSDTSSDSDSSSDANSGGSADSSG